MEHPTSETFYRDEFLQAVFDAIPAFVFIVDSDVKLLFWNSMARQLVGEQANRVYLKKSGEAFRCIHASETPDGCNASVFCKQCVIRTSVGKSLRDMQTSRAFTRVQLCSDDKVKEIFLLVTASPFTYHKKVYTLLILEDVSHVIALEEARGPAEEEEIALLAGKEREILTWLKK